MIAAVLAASNMSTASTPKAIVQRYTDILDALVQKFGAAPDVPGPMDVVTDPPSVG
jgi:hypothetical protein